MAKWRSIHSVEPGSVLADDVFSPDGRLIRKCGAQLEQRHIEAMKIWGVNEIALESDDEEQVEEQNGVFHPDLEPFRAQVDPFFPHSVKRNPFIGELYRLALLERSYGSSSDEPWKYDLLQGAEEGTGGEAALPGLNELVLQEVRLVSYPAIYFQIKDVLESPLSSASHIADVVSKDSSLSARLLKLVNSSFFGFRKRIESITRAVAIIGSRELTTLALGVAAVRTFGEVPSGLLDMQTFWRHSIAVGVFARILASFRKIPERERMFVGGLLHDVGRLVLLRRAPKQMLSVIREARGSGRPMQEIELDRFGYSHAQVGAALLREWKIPDTLVELVRRHHSPLRSTAPEQTGLVTAADTLAIALQIGTSGSLNVPSLPPEEWERAGLSPRSLEPAVTQGRRQIEEIFSLFF
ncbi:MAG: HDOD domain-containing protein [Synergistales bacterium]|nr:HDOD domain-containing protein [Synergistales bacterium]